ncbi:ribonuclease R [Psychromonas sp. Urea-02u-13]|uniref:ribonuclease R n=1 Tax=Psychromonas sp. Urea-02u-13 TaxID=2058326 RepID=UPI000C33E10B|nr:ribonuclease R [Psychromonas sp. Urea-02u-13]PKG39483.1 ribonuclease R [Psychromonas sp. Urea-02u-13]
MTQDPHIERESQTYEHPVPSREFILEFMQKQAKPITRDAIFKAFSLSSEEEAEGLRRRLKAMERDGQLVWCRKSTYALPEKLDLVQGKVIGHKDGFGFLKSPDQEKDLFLPNHQMRFLFHGDEVLAQPVKVDSRGRTEARFISLVTARQGTIVGRYFVEDGLAMVIPDDSRINQQILISKENNCGARHGQIVVVEITNRPKARFSAMGKITEVLGQDMEPGMEVEIALRTHDIPHEWPEGLDKELKVFGEFVPDHAIEGRVDLRELPLVTIDGEDARDFDDAVFCQKEPGGGWRLWVAIADVSYYVRNNTILDKEAINRGNSVYFPDQVIPMLPEVLSNGLCSLNPQVNRLCMVSEMVIGKDGHLKSSKFYEAVMKSHARFTYTKVSKILEGDEELREQYNPLVPHLEELEHLYKAFKRARKIRGGMEFETLEVRFLFNEARKIESIVPLVRNDAHKIIEECMIAANVASARLIESAQAAALFRVHETPSEEKLVNFRSFLGELGLSLGGGDKPAPRDYADLAEVFAGREDSELLQTMLLRSMKQAVYQDENLGHFGLALGEYSHFTSPIRRYPDLILHRAIKYLVKHQEKGQLKSKWTETGGFHYQHSEMGVLGEHCSMTERRADDATRDVADALKCEYMQDHIGDVMVGTIAAVTNFGFFVRLNDIHIDGLVHISGLISDYYIFDAGKQTLKGERTGRTYRIGDVLEVKVLSVNLDDKKIDFELNDEEVAGQRKRGLKDGDKSKSAPKKDRPIDKRKRNKKERQENEQSTVQPDEKAEKKPKKVFVKNSNKLTEEELAKRKAANKQKKKPQRKIAQGAKNTASSKKKKTTATGKKASRAARTNAKPNNNR